MGAWGLAVADAELGAVEEVVRHGGAIPAALVAIVAHPPGSIEELRPTLGLSQPGAARLVDRLVTAGWVKRTTATDGRAVAISATASGRRLATRLLTQRQTVLRQLLEPLDDAECDQLAGLLEKLLAARTDSARTLNRICRICNRPSCDSCPVAESLTTNS